MRGTGCSTPALNTKSSDNEGHCNCQLAPESASQHKRITHVTSNSMNLNSLSRSRSCLERGRPCSGRACHQSYVNREHGAGRDAKVFQPYLPPSLPPSIAMLLQCRKWREREREGERERERARAKKTTTMTNEAPRTPDRHAETKSDDDVKNYFRIWLKKKRDEMDASLTSTHGPRRRCPRLDRVETGEWSVEGELGNSNDAARPNERTNERTSTGAIPCATVAFVCQGQNRFLFAVIKYIM